MSTRLAMADLIDPLTGFGSRQQLITDLTEALLPDSAPGVLAIYELAGVDDYRQINGDRAGDALVRRLADEFARIIQPSGRCYRSRQNEFCILFQLPVTAVESKLAAAAIALRREGEVSLVTTSFGIALLPDEADEPVEALMIADQHLAIARRARLRRSLRGTEVGRAAPAAGAPPPRRPAG